MDDLYAVAINERGFAPQRARNDGKIAFDGHLAPVEAKPGDELGEAGGCLEPLFSIDRQAHAASL